MVKYIFVSFCYSVLQGGGTSPVLAVTLLEHYLTYLSSIYSSWRIKKRCQMEILNTAESFHKEAKMNLGLIRKENQAVLRALLNR